MNKYLTESIGTFFLVFVIALTGNPIAIGAILMCMIYMGGYISGGHYNPAVTFTALLRGKIAFFEAIKYMIAQLAGAVAASVLFLMVKGTPFVVTPAENATFADAFLIEVLFTFALCSVVMHTAMEKKNTPNQFYGIAIGFTVLAAAFAGGGISGGAFNPAVGIGPLIANMTILTKGAHAVLYLAGPFTGALLTVLVHNAFTLPESHK